LCLDERLRFYVEEKRGGRHESVSTMVRFGVPQASPGSRQSLTMPANPSSTTPASLSSEVPKYGLHALRHACATLWIEQRHNPKQKQTLTGHSSIKVTFDTYGHFFADSEEADY
jgi:site-specific recombinase XerD